MSSTVRHVGFANPEVGFPLLERRSLAVNTANLQLAVGDEASGLAAGQPLPLLAIRFFATTAQYVTGDFTLFNGQIWKAKAGVTPGPFDPSEWVGMTDGGQFLLLDGSREMYGNLEIDKPGASLVLNAIGASQADIWYRRDSLTRWLLRSDETAAVDFHIYRFDAAGFVIDAPLSINRANGRVSILFDPLSPLDLVPKRYVDAGITTVTTNVNDRVLRAGDTMTGGLVVPVLTINNPSYSDLYFSNAGHARWLIRGADATSSNLEFHHYNVSGAYLGAALVLDITTGDATFQGFIKAPPGLTFGGNAPVGFYGDGSNVAIRTYANKNIYFQNEAGSLTYGTIHSSGLDVYNPITSTIHDGLRNTVPAGQHARTQYTVVGVRQRSAGTLNTGDFQITDESAGRADIRIDTNGKVWFANDANIPGMLTVNNLTITGSTSGGGGTGGGIDVAWIEGPHYIDFRYPGDGWDNSARIIVNGASASPGGKSPLEIQSGGVTISSNLHVTGTITSGGGGTGGGLASFDGYGTRCGTAGPNGIWGFFNIGGPDISIGATPMGLWLNTSFTGYFDMTPDLALLRSAAPLPAMWEPVKALKPVGSAEHWGFGEDTLPNINGNYRTLAVVAALTKALQEAMERIEALELKVQELTNAGAR